MTAVAPQPKIRGERRIIERPRLIKLLDESEARTILLLAPAGYGKTTLARQWAKTLNGAIWVTLTPAHRDVATLAQAIADGIDALGGNAGKFIREYLRARSNPQRAAREVALSLAGHVTATRVQWIVLDDYHELSTAPEAESFVDVLHDNCASQFLVASRLRPTWATSRRALYGEIAEISRDLLAMDEGESRLVLGRNANLHELVRQAEGWPAVLGLAAGSALPRPPGEALPSALHDYFADELYKSAPEDLQRRLIALALAPDLTPDAVADEPGTELRRTLDQARDLGFLSTTEKVDELHPLIREFLLDKLSNEPGAERLVRDALEVSIRRERWDRAFELILRFKLLDVVESTLEIAYRPLTRSGQLGTLSSFAATVKGAPTFPPAVVDLVEADVALRDGAYQLASDIASRVQAQLSGDHALRSKAYAIIGQSAFVQARLPEAESAYRAAFESAKTDDDEAEALYGWALASVQGEAADSTWVVSRLAERRHRSPLDTVRHGTVEVASKHFGVGLPEWLDIDEELHVLEQVEDPRARSSFASIAAYVTGLQAEYQRSAELMQLADAQINAYDLDFARPHSLWNNAFVALGLRRFGTADRCLQLLEDTARRRPLGYHILNARALRARLALQTGQLDVAFEHVRPPNREAAIPSIHGEYLATRALVHAVRCNDDEALATADAADSISTAVEVRMLACAARTVCRLNAGQTESIIELWAEASRLGTWDPVVTALRSSPRLAREVADIDSLRPALADLYARTNDLGLARRAGLRARSNRTPEEILSPRELEVLGLLAQGFRNRDIAQALVISESTTKVHVRHIFEKLGVRTRAEAVARLTMLD